MTIEVDFRIKRFARITLKVIYLGRIIGVGEGGPPTLMGKILACFAR